ncbi:hypothetical protein [Pseudomonas sp. TMP25]|uniref:hypothetical protein n=1 Tax=Pseudomonas sp. TMP25 TaxID=3136561 RepID=UPI003100EBEA
MTEPDPPDADVHCDVCDCSTRVPGFGEQFGVLHAHWGYGSQHDGERYRVRVCESCFFHALLFLRQERRINRLFEGGPSDEHAFGLVARDDYFRES